MKKIIFSIVTLCLINQVFSQSDIAMATNHTSHNFKSKSVVKNVEYLSKFNSDDISDYIKNFQTLVANYDITKQSVYNSQSSQPYKVVFRDGKNKITAVYDVNGILISCKERFSNIRLPISMSKQIASDYPGWAFINAKCNIMYISDKDSKISYKLELKKDGKRKVIKIDV